MQNLVTLNVSFGENKRKSEIKKKLIKETCTANRGNGKTKRNGRLLPQDTREHNVDRKLMHKRFFKRTTKCLSFKYSQQSGFFFNFIQKFGNLNLRPKTKK